MTDSPIRLLLATDAWHPQVNGVVRTLDTTVRLLRSWGDQVRVIEPSLFWQFPVPFYPEIPFSLPGRRSLTRRILEYQPTHVHIATEGMIGCAVRGWCVRRGWRFTTSYHTNFPQYLHRLIGFPKSWSYAFLRWFHRAATQVMVATPSLERELIEQRFQRPLVRWSRGVDLSLFYPRPKKTEASRRPVLLYVGRVSKEKGIEDFLRLPFPGTKRIVGDGPIRAKLEREYPEVEFLGYRRGEALAEAYADADVFVFPSRTDTFGLVVIEALASGVPVAAYPVMGPIDILTEPHLGALDTDLSRAVQRALAEGRPEVCAAFARRFIWDQSTRQFRNQLVFHQPADGGRRAQRSS